MTILPKKSVPKTRLSGSLKRPEDILTNQKGILSRVYQQSRELLTIQAIIQESLPDNVYVASIQEGCLHLVTSSSSAATRIKYGERNLVSSLRNRGKGLDINKITVSIRPDQPETKLKAPEPTPLSRDSAEQLSNTAEYIEDEKLREALINLSKRR